MEPLPGGVPTVAGRTPIACQNCASAKTGCDKRVPCSRCAEKNLPCAARFARRSSKAAVRAAQASVVFGGQLTTSPAHQGLGVTPAFMDMDTTMTKSESPARSPTNMEPAGTMDPRLQGSPQHSPKHKTSPAHSHISPDDFPSPHTRVEGSLEEFMALGNDFVSPDTGYQDLLVWPDYPIELDMYAHPLQGGGRVDLAMPPFVDLGEISSSSEPTTATSSRGSIHTRSTSILSSGEYECQAKAMNLNMIAPTDSSIPEFEVVLAAEASWPLARCNPPLYSGACPRTAIVHLECFEQKSKQEGTWNSLEQYLHNLQDTADVQRVVPLTSRSRDKMLAMTQSFLHKALDIHRGGIYPKSNPGDFNFIVLPPSNIVEYFLCSYVQSLSLYYPLVMGGVVDPNDMLSNNQASTLLVLLMIAQGAAAVPTAEARYLSAGLTETCRISLFDCIEKNVELSADPTALRCALLFTLLGAWGGDKWQMDIAMGQRGMYLSVSWSVPCARCCPRSSANRNTRC